MTGGPLRLTIVSGLTVLVAGCRIFGGAAEVEPNPEVLEALREDGEAQVVVALVPPPGYDEGGPVTAAQMEAIARLQDEVLGSLDAADFRLRLRFEAVPALAGTILTERGLRVLSSHPDVVRVDLDVGGGGAPRPAVRDPRGGSR
jgi:hypothetical protein